MRIYWGIILVLAVSYCTAQNEDEDLIFLATAPSCEVNSGENDGEGEGVCVRESQCTVPLIIPDPEITTSTCTWSTGCCPKDKVVIAREAKPPLQLGCGYSNPGGVKMRNIGLNKAAYAAYADFPWMVALMVKKDIPNKTFQDEYIGGGTLIHPTVVMTVAHKVYQSKANELKCRAGEWDWSIKNAQQKHQERDVADIIINENFDKEHIYYDVALLILSSPYDMADTPHIGVGCLEPTLPNPGTVCYSMGWGKDLLANNDSAKVLKKLELPLVGKNDCEDLLRKTILGGGYALHKSLTCAGGEANVDTCEGDGGSPLVCRIHDRERLRYSVVGMVAYGVECGLSNVPGVYAKVPDFYDWIVNKMTMRNLDISSFKY